MRAHLYQVLKIVLEFTRVFQMNLAIESAPGSLKTYMRVTDEALLAETS